MILGNNVSKVVIRDLHLTRSTPGAMQGFVTKVTKGQVYLEIPPGEGRPKKIPSRQLIFISSKSIIIAMQNPSENQLIEYLVVFQVNTHSSKMEKFP